MMNTPDQERAAIAESNRRAALAREPKAPRACPPHTWFLQSGSPAGLTVTLKCHGACGQTREISRAIWETATAGGGDPVVEVARGVIETKLDLPTKPRERVWVS